MGLTEDLINSLRPLIKQGQVDDVAETYQEWEQQFRGNVNWPEVWKRCFILACLQRQKAVAEWLYAYYQKAPLGFRLGLRPVFHYCHALLVKQRRPGAIDQQLGQWLEKCKTDS